MSDRWMESLQNLLPVQPGQVIEASGLELCSISERPFTAEENAVLQENGGAFLQTNYRLKGAMIVVAPRVCPILSLMGVWHESAHFIRGDSGLGYARDERVLENDELESRTQQLAEMSRRRRSGGLLDHCSEQCFLAQPQPTSCTHPDLQQVTDGLAGLEVGGEELLGELVRRARTSAGQQWFAAAGNAVVLGSNKATPLLRTPRSRDNPYHPAWKPPLDEADIQQLALAIGQQVSTAYFAGTSRGRSEILAEGHEIRLQDEGGRIVAALPAPRQLRFSEQDGETLVERYVTLDGGPIEGEIGEWREPPDDQEGQ